MQSINSKFKYTVDLGVTATRTTFNLRKSRKDKVSNILLIVFIFIMSAVLVWDIIRGAGFVIDLIILIALIGMEIFSLVMPKIIVHTQKKFLNQLNLNEMDYTITEITKNKCTESYYKDNKIVMQNVCDIANLMAYEIKDNYIFVVFSNFACAIFDVNTLNISTDDFVKYLNETIAKNKSGKKVKSYR